MDLDRRRLSLAGVVRPNHHVHNPDERTSAQTPDPVVAAVPIAERSTASFGRCPQF